jgi:hypothetical protein
MLWKRVLQRQVAFKTSPMLSSTPGASQESPRAGRYLGVAEWGLPRWGVYMKGCLLRVPQIWSSGSAAGAGPRQCLAPRGLPSKATDSSFSACPLWPPPGVRPSTPCPPPFPVTLSYRSQLDSWWRDSEQINHYLSVGNAGAALRHLWGSSLLGVVSGGRF